jgi:hypothetical protein
VRRHPTPGYQSSVQLLADHINLPSEIHADGSLEVFGDAAEVRAAWLGMLPKLGLHEIVSEIRPGMVRAVCPLCGEGPSDSVAKCDAEKHRAYYDAIEAQDRDRVRVSD